MVRTATTKTTTTCHALRANCQNDLDSRRREYERRRSTRLIVGSRVFARSRFHNFDVLRSSGRTPTVPAADVEDRIRSAAFAHLDRLRASRPDDGLRSADINTFTF